MITVKRIIVLTLLLCAACFTGAQPLVSVRNDKLVYTPYANTGQTNAVNVVPDFSSCGYAKGGVKLPVVKNVITLSPKKGDCREMIQEAIDALSAGTPDKEGIRGAVLLKKGIYHVDGVITIKAGGVVLRGEGTGTDGTVLVALQRSRNDFITIQGEGTGYGAMSLPTKITTRYLATGAKELEVEQGHSFKAGDAIIVQETPNEAWIAGIGTAQYGWKAGEYTMLYERTVTAVKGNTIMIDIPVVDPIEQKYGEGVVFKADVRGRIKECGVENLRIESVFETDEDEDHGWNAVVLKRAENCWVKNVTAKYFGYACVSISATSAFNTVEDCAMIDPKSVTTGGRKYSFNIEHGSMGNLVQRCISWGGRHDYVTGSRVPGPNVFLDCLAKNTFADIGPHHRWSTGLLFDNVYGGEIRVQNRKAMGSGHGWAGVQTLFWNCYSEIKEIKVESPVGTMNWGVGCIGVKQNGAGYWESWGRHVTPRSLYLKQLEERLGSRAVNNVTTVEQRSGPIWESLKTRAAEVVEEPKVLAP